MMDWTDRHCRMFHRVLTRHAVLYSEMITADAVRFGDREKLLGFDPAQQPVALQLGGSDPDALAQAAQIGAELGYCEINLNAGCPSNRVQSGRFGACLMADPDLVASCVAAMDAAVSIPVTVKCRIGIDDQDSETGLDSFCDAVSAAGTRTVIVHARKAWLDGLSPKQNRDVPPLDYDRVYRLKKRLPDLQIIINGGIQTLDQAHAHLVHVDGVMLGRAAYQSPDILRFVDREFFSSSGQVPSAHDAVLQMLPYIGAQIEAGTRLSAITRHMLGMFQGRAGARAWRRVLSEEAPRAGAGVEVVRKALDQVAPEYADAAE